MRVGAMNRLVALSFAMLIIFTLMVGCSDSVTPETTTAAATSDQLWGHLMPSDHLGRLGSTCRSCHGNGTAPEMPAGHATYDTTAYANICFACHRGYESSN